MTIPEVHLWSGETGEATPADAAVLSAAERARAARFADPVESGHYVGAHARVRRILARYLECGAAEIEFGRHACPGCGDTRHGRPAITAPATGISFNHSRCGPFWVLAVAPGGERVGVDVERVRPLAAFDGLLARCLTARERRWVLRGGATEHPGRFLRCWVRKEALLKGVGTGIATDLTQVETVAGADFGGLRALDLPLGPRLVGCVAVEPSRRAVPSPSAVPAPGSPQAASHQKVQLPDSSTEPKKYGERLVILGTGITDLRAPTHR
uniref:Phosphopantetheinyl transferase n=1 Tax=Streptomyces sp. CNH287 TaxID=1288082 RepID=U6A204_9ACTN|nr:phosphopantetheinyl transferase [Streptomyces sp. CNH287]